MPCAEHKAARCTQERDGRGEREWMEEGGGERERASEGGGGCGGRDMKRS